MNETQTHTAEAGGVTTRIAELEAERAQLEADNAAAPGWGAAVGARAERIAEIDSSLAWLKRAAHDQFHSTNREEVMPNGAGLSRDGTVNGPHVIRPREEVRASGGDAILAGLRDAIAFAEGDASRATVHHVTVENGKAVSVESLAASPAPRAPAAVPEELRRLSEAASPGVWGVYAEAVSDLTQAESEVLHQVRSTPNPQNHMFMLNAEGLCPALTGWGERSEANAHFIAALVNAFRSGTLAAAPAAPPADGGTEEDRDDVLFAFHRYVDNPTPFEVTWWTRHFPQFAQDIRDHAVEVIDMNFRAANPNPDWAEQVARRVCDEHDVGSATFDVAEALRNAEATGYTRGCTTPHISHAPIASFIARDCACCSDQPTVPPDCPACHGTGGFTRYQVADGMIAKVPPALSPRTPAGAAGGPVGEADAHWSSVRCRRLLGLLIEAEDERKAGRHHVQRDDFFDWARQELARPASPAPAASAEIARWLQDRIVAAEQARDAYPDNSEKGAVLDGAIGALASVITFVRSAPDAALAPAAQVNPGRPIAGWFPNPATPVDRLAVALLAEFQRVEPQHPISQSPALWVSTFVDLARVAILAARPVAEGDAWTPTGAGRGGLNGAGEHEWYCAATGVRQHHPYGFNPNTGRYEGMTFTNAPAARPAPSPAKGGTV